MVLGRKGGVGKSCTTALVARKLAQQGFQIGLLDANLCSPSIPIFFQLDGRKDQVRIEKSKGWLPVEVEKNLKVMSIGKNDPCYLVIATNIPIPVPPDVSEEHMAITRYMQREGSDGVLVVATPGATALQCLASDLCLCQKMGLKVVGVVENKVVTKSASATATASAGHTTVLTTIPRDASLDEADAKIFSILKPSPKVDGAVQQLAVAITKNFGV